MNVPTFFPLIGDGLFLVFFITDFDILLLSRCIASAFDTVEGIFDRNVFPLLGEYVFLVLLVELFELCQMLLLEFILYLFFPRLN